MSGAKAVADGILGASSVTLFNIRRKLRALPDLGDFGILPSSTEYGQADFDALVAGLVAAGTTEIFVPSGNYNLGEQINIGHGISFEGVHKSYSCFLMKHVGTGFVFTGLNSLGGSLRKLSIINASGAPSAAYVQLVAELGGTSPDFFVIDGCNLTSFGGQTVSYGIILDGNARDGSAPNALQGIRDINIIDTEVFSCSFLSLEARNARGLTMRGLQCNATGVGGISKTSITGASSLKASYGVKMTGCALGDVSVDYSSKVIAEGNDINHVTVTANVSSSRIGVAFGMVSNSSPSTTIVTG